MSFPMPRSPLLNPPSRGVQGASLEDWVTLWFLGFPGRRHRPVLLDPNVSTHLPTKLKETTSPTDALTVGGTKNSPWSPTLTFGAHSIECPGEIVIVTDLYHVLGPSNLDEEQR